MTDLKKKKTFFPSYQAIYHKISTEQTKQYLQKINKINGKIEKMKTKINFDDQHRQLTKKLILDYKKENIFEKSANQELTDLKIIENKRVIKYADSLNQYLENSEEQENNYEAHLKFRKKALQRQLLADQCEDRLSKSRKFKYDLDEQQQFFRDLYKDQPRKIVSSQKQNLTQFRQMQNRCANLAENKKKLTELYLPFVKALGETNIVKWRVLNG